MSHYTIRMAGITVVGTRSAAEQGVAAGFGADVAKFSTAVGPIGADEVTHWLLATKTRPVVLPYYIRITNNTHDTEGTTNVIDADGLGQTISLKGVVRGAWRVYDDRRKGGHKTEIAKWLADMGLEIKRMTVDGVAPIDTAIQAAKDNEL